MDELDHNRLISLCPDPIIGVTAAGVICVFNEAAEALLGYSAHEVLDTQHIATLYADLEDARAVKQLIMSPEHSAVGKVEGVETRLKKANGDIVPIRLSASTIIWEDGEEGTIGFFHDLSERKRLEGQLQQQAITDELTGLYNQRHFYTSLCTQLSIAAAQNQPLSLMCIDLDNLKLINDRFGHLAGDEALSAVGTALRKSVRNSDLLFRYGGDEFMAILPGMTLDEAGKVCERVRVAFNRLCFKQGQSNDSPISATSLSIGVTCTLGGESSEEVVRRADMAMYRSKRYGGDRSSAICESLEYVFI